MKSRNELTVLFTSIRAAYKKFMTCEEVTADELCEKLDMGVSVVKEITQDTDNDRLASLMFSLISSEAARQQFYNQYSIPYSYAYT